MKDGYFDYKLPHECSFINKSKVIAIQPYNVIRIEQHIIMGIFCVNPY